MKSNAHHYDTITTRRALLYTCATSCQTHPLRRFPEPRLRSVALASLRLYEYGYGLEGGHFPIIFRRSKGL